MFLKCELFGSKARCILLYKCKNKEKEAADAASFVTVVSESHIAMSDTRVKLLWLVVLLSCKTLLISQHLTGQLPQVIYFEAVTLFVVSGAGFTLSNFNTDAGDYCQSGGVVPISPLLMIFARATIDDGSLIHRTPILIQRSWLTDLVLSSQAVSWRDFHLGSPVISTRQVE